VVTQEDAARFHRRGESCSRTQSYCRSYFGRAREERNSHFGECVAKFYVYLQEMFYAYLRRTPRTLPWMLTLAQGVDGGHLGVRGLEADHAAFTVEALEGGVGAVDEGDDDLAFAAVRVRSTRT